MYEICYKCFHSIYRVCLTEICTRGFCFWFFLEMWKIYLPQFIPHSISSPPYILSSPPPKMKIQAVWRIVLIFGKNCLYYFYDLFRDYHDGIVNPKQAGDYYRGFGSINITYYFKVRAGNGCTPWDFSNEVSATPAGVFITAPAIGFEEGVLGVSTDKADQQQDEREKEQEGTVKGVETTPTVSPPEVRVCLEIL